MKVGGPVHIYVEPMVHLLGLFHYHKLYGITELLY